jgi:hypothetical protein
LLGVDEDIGRGVGGTSAIDDLLGLGGGPSISTKNEEAKSSNGGNGVSDLLDIDLGGGGGQSTMGSTSLPSSYVKIPF